MGSFFTLILRQRGRRFYERKQYTNLEKHSNSEIHKAKKYEIQISLKRIIYKDQGLSNIYKERK